MNGLNLPTDNIYKLHALACLMLIFTSLGVIGYQINSAMEVTKEWRAASDEERHINRLIENIEKGEIKLAEKDKYELVKWQYMLRAKGESLEEDSNEAQALMTGWLAILIGLFVMSVLCWGTMALNRWYDRLQKHQDKEVAARAREALARARIAEIEAQEAERRNRRGFRPTRRKGVT